MVHCLTLNACGLRVDVCPNTFPGEGGGGSIVFDQSRADISVQIIILSIDLILKI
jgi:hypothetical protein